MAGEEGCLGRPDAMKSGLGRWISFSRKCGALKDFQEWGQNDEHWDSEERSQFMEDKFQEGKQVIGNEGSSRRN